jgi:hypothetical protein
MSELIALFLASLPVVAVLALVVLTMRVATGPGDYPPVDLLHRSYGA